MNVERILIVDDEANIRRILSAVLETEGYRTVAVETLAEAREIMMAGDVQVVLTDLRLQREDGLDLLRWIREQNYFTPVIILTAHGTVDSAVDAMKQGAFDYVSKPFERSELVRVIQKAALTYKFQNHHFVKAGEPDASGFPMIGRHRTMKEVFSLVKKVAGTSSTVLICGESGTGKELVAQAIHDHSDRRKGPFIKINCAAIPSTLMESELFGYERGAFTGAVNSKPGRFELADGGTLFLDEIGEMSVEMQVKLLRVLQEQTFERVGGIRTTKVDVRLITATNKDLLEEVSEGRFREDLYYRLNVVPVHLPPLRDRPSDIPLLVAHFVEKFSARMGRKAPEFSADTLKKLCEFSWPGNIRQLENVVERLLVIREGDTITPEQLPKEILGTEEESLELSAGQSLKDQVRDATRIIERKAIEAALRENEFNVTRTARSLNISRKGLQLKMKELGLRQG